MRRLAVLAVLLATGTEASTEKFPLTRVAWETLQAVRKDERFYTHCFSLTGPAKDLPAMITKAQTAEAHALILSDCSGETAIAPEHLFQLGLMYCKREALKSDWVKIEAGLKKCVAR